MRSVTGIFGMPKVWVTRTRPGAAKSAEVFKAHGFVPVIAPLLQILPSGTPLPALTDEAVLIITSQNAVKELARQVKERHWVLVCVGEATAEVARSYGFENVRSADGTSSDVTEFVCSNFTQNDRPFWHLSGNIVRGSIVEDLTHRGYNAKRHIIYTSIPVSTLPELDVGVLDVIAFYSPMAAKTLCGFDLDVAHISAVSLSPAVDTELETLNFKSRYVAARPTEAALIRALDCST